jgi:hypothetical protein
MLKTDKFLHLFHMVLKIVLFIEGRECLKNKKYWFPVEIKQSTKLGFLCKDSVVHIGYQVCLGNKVALV